LRKTPIAVALSALALAAPAGAAAPTFAIGASAVVLPAKPSFAPKPLAFRDVYRAGKGIYCVAPAPSLDWPRHAPLVAPRPELSARGGGSLVASWEAGGQRCPAAAIQVRTYRLHGGRLAAANDVAFQVLVGGAD
jgi:hypothetical protein